MDMKSVLNGLQKVLATQAAIEKTALETKLNNSSLKTIISQIPELPNKVLPNDSLPNLLERASMVPRGIHAYVQLGLFPQIVKNSKLIKDLEEKELPEEEIMLINEDDLEGIYIKSLGVELLQEHEEHPTSIPNPKSKYKHQYDPFDYGLPKNASAAETLEFVNKQLGHKIHPAAAASNWVNSAGIPLLREVLVEIPHESNIPPMNLPITLKSSVKPGSKPLSNTKPESRLGIDSKQRKVPANRISRLVSYGGLAAGLGMGALAEVTKRSLGLKVPSAGTTFESNLFLTDANAERIVDTLCRVRGAALKIGQILSIQDNSMISPELQKVFERVRHAADFMPNWQMEKMMKSEFGPSWKSRFAEFDPKPFAAASIGQVHLGRLEDGRQIAVKIQYPGVAKGIESDIDNLMAVLNVWQILPQGMFAENLIEVAKRELSWEVDYLREKDCANKFRTLLQPYPDYYVPEVIEELTTKQVFTTELIEGIPVDQCVTLDQESRDRICFLMLDLFFRELFEFQFMQTDPNWSNFLYNLETKQIGLLDFGASREYKKEFVDKYLMILRGASTKDTELVVKVSEEIGFLTGYESDAMRKAHVDTVMLLGEAFRVNKEPYDFGRQDITLRIQNLVPVMVKERLCPPPEEIYSLHRKLSGIFLLCAKLKGRVDCQQIFERIWSSYKFGKV